MAHFSTHQAPLERLPLKAFQFDLSLVGFLPRLADPSPTCPTHVRPSSSFTSNSSSSLSPSLPSEPSPMLVVSTSFSGSAFLSSSDEPRGTGRSSCLVLEPLLREIDFVSDVAAGLLQVPVPQRKLNLLLVTDVATMDCMISMRLLAFPHVSLRLPW